MDEVSTEVLIRAENLARRYGPHAAVTDLSFELRRGQVLGLLGPNGAGKTTSLRMLTGTLAPQAGRIHINGMDLAAQPAAAKARLGYLPERPPLHPELRVDEFLRFCARLHGADTSGVERAIAACGLTAMSRRVIRSLSKGYQQRVGLAQAIVHDPAVIILDEPTVGLDPNQMREMRRLIRSLAPERAIILSSHILSEVEAVCDQVIILAGGQVVFKDALHSWRDQARERSLVIGLRRPPPPRDLGAVAGVAAVEPLAGYRFRLGLAAGADPREELASLAAQRNWGLFLLTEEARSLEERFAELTGG